jgi:hypothetical protein
MTDDSVCILKDYSSHLAGDPVGSGKGLLGSFGVVQIDSGFLFRQSRHGSAEDVYTLGINPWMIFTRIKVSKTRIL